jgi:hypothetical protein
MGVHKRPHDDCAVGAMIQRRLQRHSTRQVSPRLERFLRSAPPFLSEQFNDTSPSRLPRVFASQSALKRGSFAIARHVAASRLINPEPVLPRANGSSMAIYDVSTGALPSIQIRAGYDPPSRWRFWPDIKPAKPLQRNAQVAPNSLGSPSRLAAIDSI